MYGNKPKLFFKYRRVDKLGLDRLAGIIENEELFFPNSIQLNDPFEGFAGNINLSGWAGSWGYKIYDQEPSVITNLKNQYKILSLSSSCFSPLMWAHYGDEGKGICLCFVSDNHFKSAEQVNYSYDSGSNEDEDFVNCEDLEKVLYTQFLIKHADWSYEKEWRIVKKSEQNYFSFGEDLVAVIFGHKIDKAIKEKVIEMLPPCVLRYDAIPGGQSGRIRLLKEGYVHQYDGTPADFVDDVDALFKTISFS